jgi:hypothetical protein
MDAGKLAVVGFLLSGVSVAQTGLAKHNVLLEGTPGALFIVNNSNHRILAYTLLFVTKNGQMAPSLHDMFGQLRKQPMSSVGIPPMTKFAHRPSTESRDANGQNAVTQAVSVVLDSVVFENGMIVGPDKAGGFDQFSARVRAEQDAHSVLTKSNNSASAWLALEAFASGQTVPSVEASRSSLYQYRYQRVFKVSAAALLTVRSRRGDVAALALAKSSDSYPMIVKGE